MIPILIINSKIESRQKKILEVLNSHQLNENHFNVLYFLEDQKLGVEAGAKIRDHLNLKPYQKGLQTVVIEAADNLSPEASNSLLKTLEEPPSDSLIILGARSEDSLLPTIISRCQIYNLELTETFDEPLDKYQSKISQLRQSPIEERFKYVEKLTEKEEFLKALIITFRQELLKSPDSKEVKSFLEDLTDSEKMTASNVNLRAIIEYLMIKLPV